MIVHGLVVVIYIYFFFLGKYIFICTFLLLYRLPKNMSLHAGDFLTGKLTLSKQDLVKKKVMRSSALTPLEVFVEDQCESEQC